MMSFQIAMDTFFARPSLLFVLMASVLPVMMSLPDLPPSLNRPEPGRPPSRGALEEDRFLAYLEHEQPLAAGGNFLRDAEDTGAGGGLPAPRTDTAQEAARHAAELLELLESIRSGVLAVGKGRRNWLNLQRLYQSSKRGPTNHFLRIGRSGGSGGDSAHNSGDNSGGSGESWDSGDSRSRGQRWDSGDSVDGGVSRAGDSSRLTDLRRSVNILSHLASLAEGDASGAPKEDADSNRWSGRGGDLGGAEEEYGRLDNGEEGGDRGDFSADKRNYSTYRRRSGFLRFGRGFYPRSNFLRIGRTAPSFRAPHSHSHSHSISVAARISRIRRRRGSSSPGNSPRGTGRQAGAGGEGEEGEEEDAESEGRARYLNQVMRMARRSYVRIGRLPSSVFLQRLRMLQGGRSGPEGSLARMRSPGFRLTKSGIMRAGKRTSAAWTRVQ